MTRLAIIFSLLFLTPLVAQPAQIIMECTAYGIWDEDDEKNNTETPLWSYDYRFTRGYLFNKVEIREGGDWVSLDKSRLQCNGRKCRLDVQDYGAKFYLSSEEKSQKTVSVFDFWKVTKIDHTTWVDENGQARNHTSNDKCAVKYYAD